MAVLVLVLIVSAVVLVIIDATHKAIVSIESAVFVGLLAVVVKGRWASLRRAAARGPSSLPLEHLDKASSHDVELLNRGGEAPLKDAAHSHHACRRSWVPSHGNSVLEGGHERVRAGGSTPAASSLVGSAGSLRLGSGPNHLCTFLSTASIAASSLPRSSFTSSSAPGRWRKVLTRPTTPPARARLLRPRASTLSTASVVEHGAERFRLAINAYFPTGARV